MVYQAMVTEIVTYREDELQYLEVILLSIITAASHILLYNIHDMIFQMFMLLEWFTRPCLSFVELSSAFMLY